MSETINLVENFKVEKVILNCGESNELETDLIKVLDKKKIPYHSCIKELNIDNNKLYFLNDKLYDNENDNSSVIYAEHNKKHFCHRRLLADWIELETGIVNQEISIDETGQIKYEKVYDLKPKIKNLMKNQL